MIIEEEKKRVLKTRNYKTTKVATNIHTFCEWTINTRGDECNFVHAHTQQRARQCIWIVETVCQWIDLVHTVIKIKAHTQK